jgi:hypothetical protein
MSHSGRRRADRKARLQRGHLPRPATRPRAPGPDEGERSEAGAVRHRGAAAGAATWRWASPRRPGDRVGGAIAGRSSQRTRPRRGTRRPPPARAASGRRGGHPTRSAGAGRESTRGRTPRSAPPRVLRAWRAGGGARTKGMFRMPGHRGGGGEPSATSSAPESAPVTSAPSQRGHRRARSGPDGLPSEAIIPHAGHASRKSSGTSRPPRVHHIREGAQPKRGIRPDIGRHLLRAPVRPAETRSVTHRTVRCGRESPSHARGERMDQRG